MIEKCQIGIEKIPTWQLWLRDILTLLSISHTESGFGVTRIFRRRCGDGRKSSEGGRKDKHDLSFPFSSWFAGVCERALVGWLHGESKLEEGRQRRNLTIFCIYYWKNEGKDLIIPQKYQVTVIFRSFFVFWEICTKRRANKEHGSLFLRPSASAVAAGWDLLFNIRGANRAERKGEMNLGNASREVSCTVAHFGWPRFLSFLISLRRAAEFWFG